MIFNAFVRIHELFVEFKIVFCAFASVRYYYIVTAINAKNRTKRAADVRVCRPAEQRAGGRRMGGIVSALAVSLPGGRGRRCPPYKRRRRLRRPPVSACGTHTRVVDGRTTGFRGHAETKDSSP